MAKSKVTQSWLRRFSKKRKTNIARHCVEPVVEITMQMSSGLGVTSVNDGTMGNA